MNTPVVSLMSELSGLLYINGEYVASKGQRMPVINPATEEITGEFALATISEIDNAVARATSAQREWWSMSALDRAAALHRVADSLTEIAPMIGECLTREMGKPFRESNWEGGASASSFRYYAELARHEHGRIAGPAIAGQMHMTLKEPLGVIVSIVPFNFPILLFGWQAAAALAAGNAIIVKPSDLTPLTLLVAMRAFEHLPPGLVQVITGGAEAGQALVAHEQTHGIAFTGSVNAARAVAHSAADRFKPVLIEASGNDPFIVMPSISVDTVARGATFAAFLNCGQVCTSAERFYVHEDIYDEFVDAFAEHARKLRIGNGLEAVDIGPLAASRERDRVERIVADAVSSGARVVTGGRRPSELSTGWFYEPTILEVEKDNPIMHGESFGPIAPVCKVRNLDEAIDLANDSELGLGANIYTADLHQAFRAVHEIESGIVWVNTPLNDNDAVPFGGRKLTGAGRELGTEGLEQFRRSKMVMISPTAEPDPEWFPYPDEDAFGA